MPYASTYWLLSSSAILSSPLSVLSLEQQYSATTGACILIQIHFGVAQAGTDRHASVVLPHTSA